MKRDKFNQMIAGVCSGIAKEIDINPLWIRLLFLILTPSLGIGLLFYIWLAIIMSEDI